LRSRLHRPFSGFTRGVWRIEKVFTDQSPLGRGIHALAKGTALVGGAVLIGLVVLVVASVTGRALLWAGLRPVPGDYELVEAGTAFAVFAFLPWAHLERGHAL